MLLWLLAGIALYYAYVFLPSAFILMRIGPAYVLGARDADPVPGPVHARAHRAHRNFQENLAPFLGLGLLAMVMPQVDDVQAVLGAQIFVLARAAYLPSYLAAVPVLRSALYTVSFAGLIMMALALV